MSRSAAPLCLGVDAAWTDHNPTALALLASGPRPTLRWVAGTYEEAAHFAAGDENPRAAPIRTRTLGDVLRHLDVAAVAIDMPLNAGAIRQRRTADTAVSRAYATRGAAVHSPTAERPGPVAERAFRECVRAGLTFLPAAELPQVPGSTPGVFFETYPHAAIIELLGLDFRLPYKVSRRGKYWPDASGEDRFTRVADELYRLRRALGRRVPGTARHIPDPRPLAKGARRGPALKNVEDRLDAVVCAYVAHLVVRGQARGYGDRRSGVWLPLPRRRS